MLDGQEVPIPVTEEEYQQQLEQPLQVSQHEVIMAYPNVLDIPNPNCMSLRAIKAKRLEEYA